MAIETQVQRTLLNYMVEMLGYEEKRNNVIGHSLIIEGDVERFLNTPLNKTSFERALKKSLLPAAEFIQQYCQSLREYLYQGSNVAIKIRRSN